LKAKKQNILVIGSGGREHALALALRRSERCGVIHCIPGNGGTAEIAEHADISTDNHEALARYVKAHDIALTVVGPEQPLVGGLVDHFRSEGLAVFGPDRAAARLEGSKAYSKDFMTRYGIPTAAYARVRDLESGLAALDEQSYPTVIKASGLAAGKGVIIAQDREEAAAALRQMFVDRVFGAAAEEVVIEEFLEGEEISIFVLTDGTHYKIFPTARDHKRAYDGDRGPNTGGMGAFSPAPPLAAGIMDGIRRRVIEPTLAGIRSDGGHYAGIIYLGLMVSGEDFKVLEYNCRFGDPEAQVILPLIESDVIELFHSAIEGRLNETELKISKDSCATVVLASGGYPGSYRKGLPISGAESSDDDPRVTVIHAGTARDGRGRIISSGGRVLAVTALGRDRQEALDRAYSRMEQIELEGSFYRRDIGGGSRRFKGVETPQQDNREL